MHTEGELHRIEDELGEGWLERWLDSFLAYLETAEQS
jgi:hypothetical protein